MVAMTVSIIGGRFFPRFNFSRVVLLQIAILRSMTRDTNCPILGNNGEHDVRVRATRSRESKSELLVVVKKASCFGDRHKLET